MVLKSGYEILATAVSLEYVSDRMPYLDSRIPVVFSEKGEKLYGIVPIGCNAVMLIR
jgi:hypothetical protein